MILAALAAALLLIHPVPAKAPAADEHRTYLFHDGFHGDTLGAGWATRGRKHEVGMTLARGSPSAATVSNDMLHLRVLPDPQAPGLYLNGHVGTEDSFTFAYGWAAARIRFHPFAGARGAFWLLTPTAILDWAGHEVDVAEDFGANRPNRARGVEMQHNVYWPNPLDVGGPLIGVGKTTNSADLDTRWHEDFHTYAVHWTPTRYTFFIDGERVASIFQGLSDAPKFLVLSLLTKDFEVPSLALHDLDTYVIDVDWVRVWTQS